MTFNVFIIARQFFIILQEIKNLFGNLQGGNFYEIQKENCTRSHSAYCCPYGNTGIEVISSALRAYPRVANFDTEQSHAHNDSNYSNEEHADRSSTDIHGNGYPAASMRRASSDEYSRHRFGCTRGSLSLWTRRYHSSRASGF